MILRCAIGGVLDGSITDHEIRDSGPPELDLSKLNFAALGLRFEGYAISKHKNTDLEALNTAIRALLKTMPRARRELLGPFAHGDDRDVAALLRLADMDLQRALGLLVDQAQ